MEMHPDNPSQWNPELRGDLGQAIKTITSEILKEKFYHGQPYTKAIGGFSFRGKTYSSLQEIYSAIDEFLYEGDNSTF